MVTSHQSTMMVSVEDGDGTAEWVGAGEPSLRGSLMASRCGWFNWTRDLATSHRILRCEVLLPATGCHPIKVVRQCLIHDPTSLYLQLGLYTMLENTELYN